MGLAIVRGCHYTQNHRISTIAGGFYPPLRPKLWTPTNRYKFFVPPNRSKNSFIFVGADSIRPWLRGFGDCWRGGGGCGSPLHPKLQNFSGCGRMESAPTPKIVDFRQPLQNFFISIWADITHPQLHKLDGYTKLAIVTQKKERTKIRSFSQLLQPQLLQNIIYLLKLPNFLKLQIVNLFLNVFVALPIRDSWIDILIRILIIIITILRIFV